MTSLRAYRAYSLLIESEIVLPELLEADPGSLAGEPNDRPTERPNGGPDVRIRYGDVGDAAANGRCQVGPYAWCATDELWLEVPGVAHFLVKQGNSIVIAPAPDADQASVRLFLLGSVFGALLSQRGLLVLHGNAIRIGDQCMVCVGASGAGKSTLAAGFLRRGHQILADDVVPIDDSGRALAGFPRIKLWRDAADRLGVDTENLSRLRPGLEKYNYPLEAMFGQQALPVRWIYLLDKAAVEYPQFTPVFGMHRFMPLFHNTYRSRFMAGMGHKSAHLKHCGQLAEKAHVSRLQRPRSGFHLDALVDAILDDVRKWA